MGRSRRAATLVTSFEQRGSPVSLPAGGRRRMLDQFGGDEQLVIIRSDRFSAVSTLLREWLTTAANLDSAVAHVIGPDPDTTEYDYWSCLDEMLRDHLTRPGGAPDDSAVAFASLISALSVQTKPCVLVLDDLYLVDDAVARVQDLLRGAPPSGLRIIATTRSDGDWPGRGLLAGGQTTIEPEALRFSPEDIGALLRSSGLDYDVRAAEIIHQLTDGLPALVHAACATVPAAEVRRPQYLDAHVVRAIDVLVDRMIRDDPELTAHRRTLLLSSASDPLTPETAGLLVGGADSPVAFHSVLDRSGLRRASGPPDAPEWRYPEVIRRSLLRLAAEEFSEDLRDYRSELIDSWLRADRAGNALRVAEASEDWPLVVDLIRQNFDTLYTRDYPTTMADQVLARVPEQLVVDDPVLSRTREVHLKFATPRDALGDATGERIAVAHESAGAGDVNAGVSTEPELATRIDLVFQTIELRVKGRFDEAAIASAPAIGWPVPGSDGLSTEDRDSWGFANVHIGLSLMMVGRFGEAVTALRRAHHVSAEPFIRRDAAGKLALANIFLDDRDEAERWLAEERRYPSLPAATEILIRPAGDVAAALLALDRVDPRAAMDILYDLGVPADREELWGFILYAWGQLALVSGAAAKGLRAIDKAMLRFAAMRDHGAVVGPLLDAVGADLHLMRGRADRAADLMAGASHPLTAPVRARVLLAADNHDAALSFARAALSDQRTTMRGSVELELVAAAASLLAGDRPEAERFLNSAVSTSQLTGVYRPFWSLPDQMGQQLAALRADFPVDARTNSSGFATSVPGPIGADVSALSTQRPSRAPSPVEQLTKRELAVLRDLATGCTIRQIAERHFVSVNTIESQVRSVYRKLSARSREEALVVARRLSLL